MKDDESEAGLGGTWTCFGTWGLEGCEHCDGRWRDCFLSIGVGDWGLGKKQRRC